MQDYEMIIDNDSINIIKELNNYAWRYKKVTPLSMLLITLSTQCVMLSISTSKTQCRQVFWGEPLFNITLLRYEDNHTNHTKRNHAKAVPSL
jgi:hypothetical protein